MAADRATRDQEIASDLTGYTTDLAVNFVEFSPSKVRIRYRLAAGSHAMSAHAISDHVIRTARAALSTAARNAHGLKSAAYSALLASLLYEQLDKELRCVQAEEVHKQNILVKAIDCCRRAAGSSAEDAVNVLRAVLELLETGVPAQVNVTPQERRVQLLVIQGSLSSPSKAVVSSSKAQLREIG